MTDKNQIAQTILEQLGGNRFIAMTGAKNLIVGDEGNDVYLGFKIGRNASGANYCKVIYNAAADLYTMEFGKIHKYDYNIKSQNAGLYGDMLEGQFSEITGMATRL